MLDTENRQLLNDHEKNVLPLVNKTFGSVLENQPDWFDTLPLVKWTECSSTPGGLRVFFLMGPTRMRDCELFFQEMLSKWLVPNETLHLLSCRNLIFDHQGHSLYFSEVILQIEKEKHLEHIRTQLPILTKEAILGALSSTQAKHILEMKRLSISGKISYLYELALTLRRRRAKYIDDDIFHEMRHFLVYRREQFWRIRQVRHLCRILCAHYLFKKAVLQECRTLPNMRHLFVKLVKTRLQYPFGLKKVLGVIIVVNALSEYECFEHRHILTAIGRILPGVYSSKDSVYLHRDEDSRLLQIYLEIERLQGDDFTLQEIKLLKQELPQELKNSIESLSPSLFIPRNEEEIYRNIIALSQELNFVRDLPHACISFEEQKKEAIRFNVILLRVLNNKQSSLLEESKKLPEHCFFHLERTAHVGFIRKKFVKEATVFSLEVDSAHFLRQNHSIDLLRARQYVSGLVERLVGPFRDYNGGLLIKQNEQLEAIKELLGEAGKSHVFHLENLFYSFTPPVVQTSIKPQVAKHIFSLFLKTLPKEVDPGQSALFESLSHQDSLSLIIKTVSAEVKEEIKEAVKKGHFDPHNLAIASIDVEGYAYLAFLLLSSSEDEQASLLRTIEETLELSKRDSQKLKIVHIHLPRATQSLDPRIGADRNSGIVLKMLYEGLLRVGKEGQIEHAIAKSFDVSSDKTCYTFHLRKSVWSNGTPLTAYDFEYAWLKILDPNFHSCYAFLFFSIKNAERAKRGEVPLTEVGIKALDESTLQIECEHPAPYFLGLTTHWTYAPLCREIDQRHPGWAYHSSHSYVCNGPFKLSSWNLSDNVQVVRNPHYWDSQIVKLDGIDIRIIEDQRVASNLFKQEQLDWFGDPMTKLPLADVSYFQSKGVLETLSLVGLFWLQLNLNALPFQSVKIRRAFAYALRREELIHNILHSEDIPATCIYLDPDAQEGKSSFHEDRVLAKRLFDEGLEELGVKKERLPPICFSHSEIEEQEALAKAIGKQWEEVFGIEVRHERLLWDSFINVIDRQEHMVAGIAWFSRYPDPFYYLDLLVHREHVARITPWKSSQYDALIIQAKQQRDPAKQKQLIYQAEDLVLKEMPTIPIMFQKHRYVKNPRLKNVIFSDSGQIDFREAYFT